MKEPKIYIWDQEDVLKKFSIKFIHDPGSDCWLWIGASNNGNYGKMGITYSKNIVKYIDAHRVSYMLHIGEIPAGLCVLHKCDTPSCVNPDHLFLGTHADNFADMDKKGRRSPKQYGRYGKGVKYA